MGKFRDNAVNPDILGLISLGGYAFVTDILDQKFLQLLRNEFADLRNPELDCSRFHDESKSTSWVILDKVDPLGFPAFGSLFESASSMMAALTYENEKMIQDQAFLVHSTSKSYRMGVLPFNPHFDRVRYLKMMIYLDDVSLGSGPIYLKKKSPKDLEEKRQKILFHEIIPGMNVLQHDADYKPILGDAGTCIIFDTNCPHYGGQQSPGHERRVIRLDFSAAVWNHMS